MTIKFHLQPKPITRAPNEQSAKVVTNESINIITRVLKCGKLVSEKDIRAVLTIFFDEVTDMAAEGKIVSKILTFNHLNIG